MYEQFFHIYYYLYDPQANNIYPVVSFQQSSLHLSPHIKDIFSGILISLQFISSYF